MARSAGLGRPVRLPAAAGQSHSTGHVSTTCDRTCCSNRGARPVEAIMANSLHQYVAQRSARGRIGRSWGRGSGTRAYCGWTCRSAASTWPAVAWADRIRGHCCQRQSSPPRRRPERCNNRQQRSFSASPGVNVGRPSAAVRLDQQTDRKAQHHHPEKSAERQFQLPSRESMRHPHAERRGENAGGNDQRYGKQVDITERARRQQR